MILSLLDIIFTVLIAALIHEMGHLITALMYGQSIEFRFSWGRLWKIPIPRYTWEMPKNLTSKQKGRVAIAGFGTEFIAAPIIYFMLPYYPEITVLHLIAYPFYAGENNDFQWLNDNFLGISHRGWIWMDIMALCLICWTIIYSTGKALFLCFV